MLDIIFDIDLTLVQAIWASKTDIKTIIDNKELLNTSNFFIITNDELYNARNNFLTKIKTIKTIKTIKNIKIYKSNRRAKILNTKKQTIKLLKKPTIQNIAFIVFIRPFVKEILKWCFNNARVSFWTSGDFSYAISIVKHLVEPSNINKIKTIITRYNKSIYIDLYTNKKYSILRDGFLVKNMDLLFEHTDYKHKFNRHNTLLIDDMPSNILENIKTHNKYNILPIEPWFYKDVDDNKLLKLLKWIMSMVKNNKIDIYKNRPILV